VSDFLGGYQLTAGGDVAEFSVTDTGETTTVAGLAVAGAEA
jgi:hypothetical protein